MVLYTAGAPGIAIVKDSKFNTNVIAGDGTVATNIFDSDLKPMYSPTTFRIYACFDAGGVLTVRRTRGIVTVSEELNGLGALVANAAYTFDIIVEIVDSVNIHYRPPPVPAVQWASCTCRSLKVVEVPGAVS